jgi:tetratricopeptide (TPR) repeat protein
LVVRAAIARRFVLLVAAVAWSSPALAQGSLADHFAEGQRLMADGKYPEACVRFEKAHILNPGAGTKLHLAQCYEKIGRPASALTLYREVEAISRDLAQHEVAATAKELGDGVEPRVPTVAVRAPWLAGSPEAVVSLDGHVLTVNELERPIRVDLGKHEARARSDRGESRASVAIERDGEAKVIDLAPPGTTTDAPLLGRSPAAAPTGTAPDPGATQRGLALAAAGVGLVTLAVSGILLLDGTADYDAATGVCGTSCPRASADVANAARDRINVGGLLALGGLALIAGGGALWFTAKAPPRASGVRVLPSLGRAGAGVLVGGAF